MRSIIIVDDEASTRAAIRMVLKEEYRVLEAEDGETALALIPKERVSLVILDVRLPGMDGMQVLRRVSKMAPPVPTIMLTATTAVRTAVEAMKLGAADYITKPFDVDELRIKVKNVLYTSSLATEVERLRGELQKVYQVDEVIAGCPAMRTLWETVDRIAAADSTVLITGESGTGKELVARALHLKSSRSDNPFMVIHCPTLPESLLESELFGHEKGAFTHATEKKIGMFELAHSGTIFLDEISEMLPSTQAKILRVLQEGEFMRVGGSKIIRTDVRILTATNRDLRHLVRQGKFREDLYYRINVVPVEIPPLRERGDDILLFIEHFFQCYKHETNARARGFSPEATELLKSYSWPGNVRELKNTIEHIMVLHGQDELLLPENLPRDVVNQVPPALGSAAEVVGKVSLQEAVSAFERDLVLHALRRTGGVQSRAAKLLKTTRRILKYKMDKLGIDSERYGDAAEAEGEEEAFSEGSDKSAASTQPVRA